MLKGNRPKNQSVFLELTFMKPIFISTTFILFIHLFITKQHINNAFGEQLIKSHLERVHTSPSACMGSS